MAGEGLGELVDCADHRAPGGAARRSGRRGVSTGDSFRAQTVETARRMLAARLRNHEIDSAELDARILVGASAGARSQRRDRVGKPDSHIG